MILDLSIHSVTFSYSHVYNLSSTKHNVLLFNLVLYALQTFNMDTSGIEKLGMTYEQTRKRLWLSSKEREEVKRGYAWKLKHPNYLVQAEP